MKTVIVNGSPRKNGNTAQLLKEARKGAQEAGRETVYVDLYDLKFTGCRSCLGCKRKGIEEPCRCYIKDELTPVLEAIYDADHLILGSPIYFGQPTGELRSLLERACFPALSYNDYSSLFRGKVDVSVFLTMNATENFYEEAYKADMEAYFGPFNMLKGRVQIIPVFNTLQVKDYSKYDMGGFSEELKKSVHENEFPAELARAFEVGKNGIARTAR